MNISIGDFTEKIHQDLNVIVSRHQVHMTIEKTKDVIYGNYENQYERLWDYIGELLRTNPGSTIEMLTEIDENSGQEIFKRLYVCFNTLKTSFLIGCRPILGVDGCHLKGPHQGVLLTAVGLDPNNCIYPVAYAVVESENKDSWSWFFTYLVDDLKIYNQISWTLIFDRQNGLIPAVNDLLPNIEHRHYVRHLHNNFKKVHPSEGLKSRMWACARSSYIRRFDAEIESLKAFDECAYKWLVENTSPNQWSRSHFRTTSKCDILLNNICESFNSVILDAREKPILAMLKKIRLYLMMRLQTKRDWMKKQDVYICPKILSQLEKLKNDSAACIAIFSGQQKFEVRHMYGEQFAIDLEIQTCDCRRWELTGIPCSHAISYLEWMEKDPEDYVHEYYTKSAYLRAYELVLCPINGLTCGRYRTIHLCYHLKGKKLLVDLKRQEEKSRMKLEQLLKDCKSFQEKASQR